MSTAIEQRARRAARQIGLIARKSRWRRGSVDNFGGFMLVDGYRNFVVAGGRFELSPNEVIEFCAQQE